MFRRVINTPIAETVKDLPVITATVTVLSLDLRVLHAFQLNIQSVHQKEVVGWNYCIFDIDSLLQECGLWSVDVRVYIGCRA